MNFWPFDPVAGHGIAIGPGRRNPLVVAISFRDLWIPGDFGRRRWRFFKAHFQFLMANERLGAAYDYYLICCGPLDLVSRATQAGRGDQRHGGGLNRQHGRRIARDHVSGVSLRCCASRGAAAGP